MKHLRNLSAIAAIALLVGCATPASRTTFNSLASVQSITSGAWNAYLDLVIQGKLATNSVPIVSRDYSNFQNIWVAAVTVAELGVQGIATAPVTNASAVVLFDIATAKKGTTP
jgi:hypothetical protein